MNPITIPNISIPTIGIPTIGIPSVGFPSASGGGGLVWPAGMKERIKAWYDPKKQGMTNFDVIESYVTDFTTWRTADKNYVGLTIRSSSFSISFNKVSNHVIMWKPNYLFNEEGQVKLQVSGITDNISIIIKHGTQEFPIVNGVNTFSFTQEENKSLSFICKNVFQDANITITQLPTSILKDFSGNGNHAYLYGGKGKLNSGMGVYKEDFTTWNYVPERGDVTRSYNTIHITKVTNTVTANIISKTNEFGNSITLKIVGATSDNPLMVGTYSKPNGYTAISKDGVYSFEIDEQYWGFRFNKDGDVNVTITQIPDYPDQLCYDGKMYAVCYGFPILTDYTVMAERTWFEKEEYSSFISNSLGGMEEPSNGAFCVEIKSLNSFTTSSFGSLTSIGIPEKGITYQTKQSYNGNSINVGTKESNDILILGGRYFYKNDNVAGNTWNGCHGAIIVADRSFTEEEINWLKQNWDKI